MDATITNSTELLLKVNETLKRHGIGLSVLLFVACLKDEPKNLKEISDKLGCSAAGITSIRDCAENNKFVREIQNPDRRKRVYEITDLGIELLASYAQ